MSSRLKRLMFRSSVVLLGVLFSYGCFSISLASGPRVPEPECITGGEPSEKRVLALATNDDALFWVDSKKDVWRRHHRSGDRAHIGAYRSPYPVLAANDKHVFLATKREREIHVLSSQGGTPRLFATLPSASPVPAIREMFAAGDDLFVATDAALHHVSARGQSRVLLEKPVRQMQRIGGKLYFIEGGRPGLGLALGSWLLRKKGFDQETSRLAGKMSSVQALASYDLRSGKRTTLWRGPADAELSAFAFDEQHVFVTLSRLRRTQGEKKDRWQSELRVFDRDFGFVRKLPLSTEPVTQLALRDEQLFFIEGDALLRTEAEKGPLLMVARAACELDVLRSHGKGFLLAGTNWGCAPFDVRATQVLGQMMAGVESEPTVLYADSRWLYFRDGDRVARVPAFGGTRTYVSPPPGATEIHGLSSLGDRLVVAADNGLWWVDSEGTEQQIDARPATKLQRVGEHLFGLRDPHLVALNTAGHVEELLKLGEGVRAFSVRGEHVYWIGPRAGGTYSERPLMRARLDGTQREELWRAERLMDVAAAAGGVYVTKAGYRISGGGNKSFFPSPPKKVELGALVFVSDAGFVRTVFDVGRQPWSIALSSRGIAVDRTGSVIYAKRGSREPHKLSCGAWRGLETGLRYANGSFYWAEASGWVLRMPESALINLGT